MSRTGPQNEQFAPTEPEIEISIDREKRVRHRLSVGITAPGQGHIAGWTSNLALHGLSVGANRVFPEGTPLRVVIQLPDQERATVEGIVTWARKGVGHGSLSAMGIRFSSDSPQYLAFMRRYHPEVFPKQKPSV